MAYTIDKSTLCQSKWYIMLFCTIFLTLKIWDEFNSCSTGSWIFKSTCPTIKSYCPGQSGLANFKPWLHYLPLFCSGLLFCPPALSKLYFNRNWIKLSTSTSVIASLKHLWKWKIMDYCLYFRLFVFRKKCSINVKNCQKKGTISTYIN